MSTVPYTPIDCSFHDRLEHHAVLGRVVCVVYRDEKCADGRMAETDGQVAEAIIRDVFAQNGADWVRFEIRNGHTRTVRADAILSVDGITPAASCSTSGAL